MSWVCQTRFDFDERSTCKCRQEAAGALWNLSFDDRNREAIAAARGVEALVSQCTYQN